MNTIKYYMMAGGAFACAVFAAACDGKKKCAVDLEYSPTSQFSAADFKNPPAQYRIVPFWSWNETMEPAEIRRQLRLMKEAGWGGSMIHSRTGLLTEYLGDDWFKAVDATIDESKKLGMLVWLYDEDKWPSGFSGGSVLKENVDYAVKTLVARPVGEKMDGAITPMGEPAGGIQVYALRAKQGNAWFNGTSYVDTMSREAMGVFKREAYDSYYKRYAKYFGNLIVAEFTDEPALTSTHYELGGSGAPYSLDFIGEFKKVYGFDPVPHFHKLFLDVEGARKYRLQHYRIAVRLFENNFMGQLGDACASRGIALTGHCMSEDSLYGQLQWSGRIMPYYRKMGIPGIDHLGRHTSGNVFTAKQCQSVCNQYGKKRMLSEMYGCSGGSLSFEDRQWIAYQQLIGGVNMIVPHLSLFSQTGCRKRDYPQNINYQQSWYGLNAAVDVPLARACYAISQGKYAADILLISPQDGVPAVWRINPDGKKPRANTAKETYDAVIKLHKNFADSVKALFGSQFTFDLGDEQLLEEDGFVRGREIGIKNMSYKVVVLPAMANMRPSTLKMLKEFSANGGLVLRTGDAAEFLDGEKSAELDEFLKGVKLVSLENLKAEIDKFTKPFVDVERKSGDASNLWTHVRDYNDGSRFIMLANLSRFENFDGVLKISGGYTRAQILDTDTGEISDVYAKSAGDTLEMKLDLLRARALFLRVSKEKPVALAPKKTETLAEAAIDGWKAERLDDNSLLLDYASFSFDGGKRGVDGEVPAIEISRYLNAIKYEGDVVVKYKFKASNFDPSRKLNLVVEYPEKASIKVNGKEVKYAGLPFWRDFRWLPIDITGLAKEGENLIEVSYPNYKYGDPTVYKPQWRRYGTEIEAAYLVGDFSVIAKDTGAKALNSHFKVYQSKPTKTVMIGKDGLAITNPKPISVGNQTLGGLAFYTGRVCYSKKIDAPKLGAGERLFIKLGNLDCPVAEVLVDGKRAGLIKNEPFELDITDAVKTPNPEIKIVLYATLRNAMDAPHNVIGEIYSIWPRLFTIEDLPASTPEAQFAALKGFADGSWKSKKWIKDYCQVSFGDLEGVKLVRKITK